MPWFHPLILVTLPLSSALFLVFVYIEISYAVEPIIPVKLLLDRIVITACLANWFFTMSQKSLTFYTLICFQVQRMPATDAGIRLIPTSVGAAVGGIACGTVMRAVGKYFALNLVIQLLFLLPLGLTTRFDLNTPQCYPFVYFFFTGFAYVGMLRRSSVGLGIAYLRLNTCRMAGAIRWRMTIWLHYRVFPSQSSGL